MNLVEELNRNYVRNVILAVLSPAQGTIKCLEKSRYFFLNLSFLITVNSFTSYIDSIAIMHHILTIGSHKQKQEIRKKPKPT